MSLFTWCSGSCTSSLKSSSHLGLDSLSMTWLLTMRDARTPSLWRTRLANQTANPRTADFQYFMSLTEVSVSTCHKTQNEPDLL